MTDLATAPVAEETVAEPPEPTGTSITDYANQLLNGDEFSELVDNSDALSALTEFDTEADALAALMDDTGDQDQIDALNDTPADDTTETVDDADDPLIEVVQFEHNGEQVELPLDQLTENWELRSQLEARSRQLETAREQYEADMAEVERVRSFTAALDQNPRGVLLALAEQMGVSLDSAPAAQPEPTYDPYGYNPDPQPQSQPDQSQPPDWAQRIVGQLNHLSSRFDTLDMQNQQRVAAERNTAAQAEFATYENDYPRHGVSYNEVVQHLRDGRFPSLKAAFHDLALPRIAERQRIAASQNTQRRAAARQQAPLAQSGQHGSRGEAALGADTQPMPRAKSVAEAMDWATQELLRQQRASG